MEQLLQDVAQVERLGDEFATTYGKVDSFWTGQNLTQFALLSRHWFVQVLQCDSDIQGLTAALAALQGMQDKTEQVWVQRPGGLVLGLSQTQALQVVQEGMRVDCLALPVG